MHLCDSCAKKNKDFDFNFPFSFQSIFTGLMGSTQEGKQDIKNISCHKCGLTYKKFMQLGKFGCADCYETFETDIDSLLKGIHGHNGHKGKIPIKTDNKIVQRKAIETLRTELDEAIANEDFERAAILRDEIKKISSKIDEL